MRKKLLIAAMLASLAFAGCGEKPEAARVQADTEEWVLNVLENSLDEPEASADEGQSTAQEESAALDEVQNTERGDPAMSEEAIPSCNEPFVEMNGNIPLFTESDKQRTDAFEEYSDLDALGRCQTAYANICIELMPTEEREGISAVKPSGWINHPYEFVDGGYIYNRCHLIGFQLAGENANENNLITGTRYMNVEGMLPFENMVADYVKESRNHVLYRVTPLYEGNDLVCRGVQMEAWSVEDAGEAVCFNVFCPNIQPGCRIRYLDGENWAQDEPDADDAGDEKTAYILNENTMKYHLPDCIMAERISKANRKEWNGSRKELEDMGYDGCGTCRP